MQRAFWVGKNRLTAALMTGALVLALLAGAASARAGDGPAGSGDLTELTIEDLMSVTVYGASKFDQKVAEAPASITIVTADDIRQYGCRTLADILESVGGLYVSYDRNYHYLGIRGFGRPGDYNTRILLLIDGIRTNDNIYQQAPIGTDFPLDVDLIDRIEIIRGPSSSLYGTNAFFGIINVVTRRGRDLAGAEAAASAGSYHTYQGRESYGKRFNGSEALVSGTVFASRGQDLYYPEFDDPATNNGWAAAADQDRFASAFAKVAYHDFTLTSAFARREKNIPTAPWLTVFNDPTTKTTDERLVVDLKYDRAFADRLGVMARLSFNRYDYDGSYQYLSVFQDYGRGSWWNAETQVTKRAGRHMIIAGTEFRGNIRQDQGSADVAMVYLHDERKSLEWAVFGQDEVELSTKLFLNAGIRYDYYESFGGTTNPRMALIGRVTDKTSVKLIYGRAFRAPNVYELYYQDSSTTLPNPELQPETITTYEVVVDQYVGARARATARGFWYVIDELITQRIEGTPPNEYQIFRNADKVEAEGAEVEVEGTWTNGVRGMFSYSFQRAVDSTNNERLTNSPEHLAKATLTVPIVAGRLLVGIEEQYTSNRKTVQGGHAPGYWLTNLTLFAPRLVAGLDLSASVYNLFDVDYGDPGGEEHLQNVIPQDGRNFRVKLTYRF